MTPEDADRLLRRLDELAASGLSPEDAKQRLIAELEADAANGFTRTFEELLDQGRTPADAKATVLAGVRSADIKARVVAKLDNSVVLQEPPRWRLSDEQAREFAEAFANLPTKEERLTLLRQLTGDQSTGQGTMKKVQRDLAERGLLDLRGVSKVIEPAAPKPEFAIPDLIRKKTRAASKPMAGVFVPKPDLAWTGLPMEAEFRANLRHIADKRARKADPAWLAEHGRPPPVGDDLTTPEKVEAHIADVLAEPTFAQVRWRDGKPYEMSIIRLGAQGADQSVGVSLHKGDGTGRIYIATAYNVRREDTFRRLSAAIEQNGLDAVKWRKTRDGLNEILELVDQAPTGNRESSWAQFKAALIREQAARRERALNAASGRQRALQTASDEDMRGLAIEAIGDGATVQVAPHIRNAVNRAASDVLDIVPAGYRIGALEKIEPITTADGDTAVRAHYRTPDGKTFSLLGDLEEFTDAGALHDRDEKVIALNVFGARSLLAGHHAARDLGEGFGRQLGGDAAAPAAGVSFDLAMRGRVFHETLHALWRDLDPLVQARLAAHSNRLGVLDKTFVEFNAQAHFEPRGPAGDTTDAVTIRDAYEELSASTDIINQEAAAHMVQLAIVGGLKAKDLAAVRDILVRLFDGKQGHMSRTLDEGPAPPKMAIDGSDKSMREEARKAVLAGNTVYVAPAATTAAHRAIADMLDLVPDNVRVGALVSLEPLESGVDNPRVRATLRAPTGERFTLEAELSWFAGTSGFFEPGASAIALNVFSRSGLAGDDALGDLVKGVGADLGRGPARRAGIPFDRAVRGVFAHEILHAVWESLDPDVRARLVSHARDLEVLDLPYHDFLQVSHWEPRKATGDAKDIVSIREMYEDLGIKGEDLDQEAATHFVQLAMVGALKAEHVAPVRDILNALFEGVGQNVSRAVDGKPRPRMASLAAPQEPRLQDAARVAQRQDATTSWLRELMDEPRTALWDLGSLARIRGAEDIIKSMVEQMVSRGQRRNEIAARLRETMGVELPPKDLRTLVSEAHEAIVPKREAPGLGAGTRDDGNPATRMLADSYQSRQIVEIIEACRS